MGTLMEKIPGAEKCLEGQKRLSKRKELLKTREPWFVRKGRAWRQGSRKKASRSEQEPRERRNRKKNESKSIFGESGGKTG